MFEGAHDPIEEAHGELSLARIALADDDLTHAANHIAEAIVAAPTLPEVHELLAVVAARSADGGLGLFPIGERAYLGHVVAHAHLLARRDPNRALRMLASATAYDPGSDWAGVPWLREIAAARLDPAGLVQDFVGLLRVIPDPTPPGARGPLLPYLDLARRALTAHPRHGVLHGAASALARRLGETDEAVRWAERGVALEPGKLTELWHAYALRSAGRVDDALAGMRRVQLHDPLDLAISSDMADWLAGEGRIEEALSVIEAAITTDPTYDCAVHTAARLRFQHDGDARHLIALADFMRQHPTESHQHWDLASSCENMPWLGYVPWAVEASMTMLRQVPEAERRIGGTVALANIEPPSALATTRRHLPGVQLTFGRVPEPDLRRPLRPGVRLWRYEGTTAFPAVAPPSAASVAALGHLVEADWHHPVAAYDRAVGLAGVPAEDLLGLLVHPPAAPGGPAWSDPGRWIRSVQVWACLGMLHHRTGEPWVTSTRRRLLVEVAFGVEDWTTEAALFALTTAAWVDPAAREDVARTVGGRFRAAVEAAEHRPVTILESLARIVAMTPQMPPGLTALAYDLCRTSEVWPGGRRLSASQNPPVRRLGWLRRWRWLASRRRSAA